MWHDGVEKRAKPHQKKNNNNNKNRQFGVNAFATKSVIYTVSNFFSQSSHVSMTSITSVIIPSSHKQATTILIVIHHFGRRNTHKIHKTRSLEQQHKKRGIFSKSAFCAHKLCLYQVMLSVIFRFCSFSTLSTVGKVFKGFLAWHSPVVSELRSCVKVKVAILGSLSLTVCTVSVDVKQHWTEQQCLALCSEAAVLAHECYAFQFSGNRTECTPQLQASFFATPSSKLCHNGLLK